MKTLKRLGLLMICFVIITACKKYEEKALTVIRDCTATYLRDVDIDLPIANPEIISSLDSGEVVTAKYYFPGTKKVKINYGEDCGITHEFPRGEWIIIEEFD